MKRCFLLLSLLIWALASAAQIPISNEFVLSGEVENSKAKIIYLSYTNKNGSKERDSCWLQNGRFSFKGSISEPTLAIIKMNAVVMYDDENRNIAKIYLEPVNMTAGIVYDHFDEMALTGSKTQDEYTALNKRRKFVNEKYSDSLYERHSNLSEEFIFNYRNSYISASELALYTGRWSNNAVQYLFTRLDEKVQKSVYGREIKGYLDGLDANSEGSKVKEFIQKDIDGKVLKLSDFKGKYVLLDFWGSWCVPCRESSPHLIELYKKYSKKGFTVIGIAVENEKTGIKWKQAIQKDGTDIWYNVLSDPLPGSPGQFTKDIDGIFGVHVFPTKLLIDPSGFIIGRFSGTGEDVKLDEKLKEIFDN